MINPYEYISEQFRKEFEKRHPMYSIIGDHMLKIIYKYEWEEVYIEEWVIYTFTEDDIAECWDDWNEGQQNYYLVAYFDTLDEKVVKIE